MQQLFQYQLVFQLPEAFFESFDAMIAFEERMIASLPSTCTLDGHDVGEANVNFFVHTNYPEAAFKAFRKYLGTNNVEKKLKVAYRNFGEENFVNLWPKKPKTAFSLFAST